MAGKQLQREDIVSEFALKLRLTAAALGCNSYKDLCARFQAINPATYFDLERAHKWLQGHALPRASQVYEDWAKVIGTERPGAWLARCPIADFLAEICARREINAETLLERAGAPAVEGTEAAARGRTAQPYLAGNFACYSLAWSPYYKGQIIRGSLLINLGQRGNALVARYEEMLLGGPIRFEGEVHFSARTLHLVLRLTGGKSPLSIALMTLLLPGRPASVMLGMMSGASFVGPDPQPCAARVALIRVPRDASHSNGYLAPVADALAENLLTLGLPFDDPWQAGELLGEFLRRGATGGLTQVTAHEQARLASVFDKGYLGHCSQGTDKRNELPHDAEM